MGYVVHRARGRSAETRCGWRWGRPRGWLLAVLAVVGWAGSRLGRVEVTGASMLPLLWPGDRLVVLRRGGPWRAPRVGDVVVLADPRDPGRTVVKRLVALDVRGADVRGDHPAASTDSRTFGRVPAAALQGRAVYRYAPPDREGRISPFLRWPAPDGGMLAG